jgi:hypothetical protein
VLRARRYGVSSATFVCTDGGDIATDIRTTTLRDYSKSHASGAPATCCSIMSRCWKTPDGS